VIKVILLANSKDDFILMTRAASWLLEREDRQDGIVSYGKGDDERLFYVKRNKSSSVTVRAA